MAKPTSEELGRTPGDFVKNKYDKAVWGIADNAANGFTVGIGKILRAATGSKKYGYAATKKPDNMAQIVDTEHGVNQVLEKVGLDPIPHTETGSTKSFRAREEERRAAVGFNKTLAT